MSQNKADHLELLNRLKTEVFEGSNEKLALALGRPTEELTAWIDGTEEIDEDAHEKIHGLAQERLSE